MQTTTRPLFKPLPLIGISSLILAAMFATRSSQPITSMTTNHNWTIKKYTPKPTWPYNPSDFTRQDSSPDTSFYSSPRFVTHIDDAAIATLRQYYDENLPKRGKILDFCSSWISHYPKGVEDAAERGELEVVGMGMNKAELEANKVLNSGRILQDLNGDPDISKTLRSNNCIGDEESSLLDASTNVVSTDYLTHPVEVLRSLREATKVGGTVHLTISNRCFPTKAISRWLRVREEERLEMVGDFLHFAGWKNIEIVELSDTKADGGGGGGQLRELTSFLGMNSRDPLWVVRAVQE